MLVNNLIGKLPRQYLYLISVLVILIVPTSLFQKSSDLKFKQPYSDLTSNRTTGYSDYANKRTVRKIMQGNIILAYLGVNIEILKQCIHTKYSLIFLVLKNGSSTLL
jgi:hypothetical protein